MRVSWLLIWAVGCAVIVYLSFLSSLVFSPKAGFGRNQSALGLCVNCFIKLNPERDYKPEAHSWKLMINP